MRHINLMLVVTAAALICSCTYGEEKEHPALLRESKYDAQLAEKTGADQYGMKKYVMAFLKKGSNRDRTVAESDLLQKAHMKNIGRLADEGKLVVAGPFLGDGEVRGIYIFNTESIEEARAWTETDPAIQAGSLSMDLHSWYGSAALMEVNEMHGRLAKITF